MSDDGSSFKRVRRRPSTPVVDERSLLEGLTEQVAVRFGELTGLAVVTVPIDADHKPGAVPPPPVHPRCADCVDDEHCRATWQAHVDEARGCSEVHWHRCHRNELCAIVPVAQHGRCFAACKLVCPSSIGEATFERQVDLLDALVENFVARQGATLKELARASAPLAEAEDLLPEGVGTDRVKHVQVRRALECIDQRFTDPHLTVAAVAREIGINTTYLAHLFSVQVGLRMSRYISSRRIALAKRLLVTTTWPIKEVARRSGHASADWFSQIFRVQTGVTPRDYRRQQRASNRS